MLRRPTVIQVHANDFQAFWEASLYVLMGKIIRRPIVLRIGGGFNRFWGSSGTTARAAVRLTLRPPSLPGVQSGAWKNSRPCLGRTGPSSILNYFVTANQLE